jgi:inorganic pyrophosphatase
VRRTKRLQVLIEAEAGTNVRRIYDETTLGLLSSREVAAAYPCPYGFILGTRTDGDAIDCYLITGEPIPAGTVVEAEAAGVLEQFEGREVDHKVLAVMPGSSTDLDPRVRETLDSFISELFRPYPLVKVRVGRLLDANEAMAFIESHLAR